MVDLVFNRRQMVLGATVAGAAMAAPALVRAQGSLQKMSILISTVPADPAFHVYYFAQEQGFYRDVGIDMEMKPTAGDATAVRVLLSGGADLASVGALPTIQAINAGTRLNIVSCYSPKLDYLLVAESGTRGGKDLEGKAVAVSQVGATSHLVAQLLIKKAGGDVSKVNWLSVGASSARVQALIAKRVAAAPLNSIFAERAAQMMATSNIGDAAEDLTDLLYGWEIATPQTIARDKQAIQGFVTATARAARWAYANPDEAAAISRKVLPQQAPAEVTSAIKAFAAKRFWGTSGELSPEKWGYTLAAMRDLGAITESPRLAGIAVPEFAAETARQLGPYSG